MRLLFGSNNDFPGAVAPGIFFYAFYPRKIPEYFEKQIFSLERGFIHGASIWLYNAVCTIRRIARLMCLKLQFHSPHLHHRITPHGSALCGVSYYIDPDIEKLKPHKLDVHAV